MFSTCLHLRCCFAVLCQNICVQVFSCLLCHQLLPGLDPELGCFQDDCWEQSKSKPSRSTSRLTVICRKHCAFCEAGGGLVLAHPNGSQGLTLTWNGNGTLLVLSSCILLDILTSICNRPVWFLPYGTVFAGRIISYASIYESLCGVMDISVGLGKSGFKFSLSHRSSLRGGKVNPLPE